MRVVVGMGRYLKVTFLMSRYIFKKSFLYFSHTPFFQAISLKKTQIWLNKKQTKLLLFFGRVKNEIFVVYTAMAMCL